MTLSILAVVVLDFGRHLGLKLQMVPFFPSFFHVKNFNKWYSIHNIWQAVSMNSERKEWHVVHWWLRLIYIFTREIPNDNLWAIHSSGSMIKWGLQLTEGLIPKLLAKWAPYLTGAPFPKIPAKWGPLPQNTGKMGTRVPVFMSQVSIFIGIMGTPIWEWGLYVNFI